MGDVYGNVNVNYSYCKSVAQLKSAADYILGRRKEQVEDGVVKTEPHLYKAFGCNRDNFANSLLITRKMHDKRYSRYKQKEILAQKISISFHPEDNDRLTYEQAYKIAEDFAREFFCSKGYEVLLAVHTDTAHIHVHFLVSNCNVKDGKSFRRGPAELKEMCRYFGEQCRKRGLVHSYRDSYYVKDKDRERQSFAEYQMKKRDKLSFREEIKVLLRNAMNRPENKTLQDVIDYAKVYYLMDVRLRGNTISYALKYRTDKKGKPMAVRGSRLGARFTVAGITEYLKKKEKSRLEYERIKADIEQESGRYDDYAEWDISDVKESVGIDTAGSVQKEYEKPEGDISVYEGFDRFCEKENIRDDEEEVFYGAAFDEFNREWQGIALEEQTEPTSHKEEQEIPPDYTKMSIQERVRQLPPPTEDTSQEFEAYKNRMGYDAAKMKSIRYKMSVYDEFLEELEARKKYHGTKAYGRQSTRKRDRGER